MKAVAQVRHRSTVRGFLRRVFILSLAGLASLAAVPQAQASPPPLATIVQQAKQGDRIAEFDLAVLYEHGEDGLPKDPAKALSWYRKSADQEYRRAEYNLGVDYDRGEDGLPKDPAKATYWYERAAAQKLKPAIAALQAMRHPQQAVIARPAPQAADATAAPPADKERVAQSLQSFWDLYFRASNAQVVDFGAPALVRPVGFRE